MATTTSIVHSILVFEICLTSLAEEECACAILFVNPNQPGVFELGEASHNLRGRPAYTAYQSLDAIVVTSAMNTVHAVHCFQYRIPDSMGKIQAKTSFLYSLDVSSYGKLRTLAV